MVYVCVGVKEKDTNELVMFEIDKKRSTAFIKKGNRVVPDRLYLATD